MKKVLLIICIMLITFKVEASAQSTNQKWLEYYKTAAMMMGTTEYIAKAEYISQFDETAAFWESIEARFYYCHDRGCFIEWITRPSFWPELNPKIDNMYNYFKSKEK